MPICGPAHRRFSCAGDGGAWTELACEDLLQLVFGPLAVERSPGHPAEAGEVVRVNAGGEVRERKRHPLWWLPGLSGIVR
jgi:hypothetical protein